MAAAFAKLSELMMLPFPRSVLALTVFLTAALGQTHPVSPLGSENLTYGVEWRMIRAGEGKLSFENSGGVVKARFHLFSSGLISRLFKVNDVYDATMSDRLCAKSVRLEAEEGSKKRLTTINWSKNWSQYVEKDLVKGVIATQKQLEVPACVHEVLGALAELRTRRLEPGQNTTIPISDGKKFAQARVEAQEREKIKTPAGTFNTIRNEAFLFNDVLYKRSARLFIWFSDDNRRLPVQIQVRMRFHIGTVTLQLDKVER